ncbi:hypothetical protein B0H13DRAFT_1923962 [Mycena leptocephala]|nr:hypothetical protein B0H13DRAFT_1923962 [Mycena leptocephala]
MINTRNLPLRRPPPDKCCGIFELLQCPESSQFSRRESTRSKHWRITFGTSSTQCSKGNGSEETPGARTTGAGNKESLDPSASKCYENESMQRNLKWISMYLEISVKCLQRGPNNRKFRIGFSLQSFFHLEFYRRRRGAGPRNPPRVQLSDLGGQTTVNRKHARTVGLSIGKQSAFSGRRLASPSGTCCDHGKVRLQSLQDPRIC